MTWAYECPLNYCKDIYYVLTLCTGQPPKPIFFLLFTPVIYVHYGNLEYIGRQEVN